MGPLLGLRERFGIRDRKKINGSKRGIGVRGRKKNNGSTVPWAHCRVVGKARNSAVEGKDHQGEGELSFELRTRESIPSCHSLHTISGFRVVPKKGSGKHNRSENNGSTAPWIGILNCDPGRTWYIKR